MKATYPIKERIVLDGKERDLNRVWRWLAKQGYEAIDYVIGSDDHSLRIWGERRLYTSGLRLTLTFQRKPKRTLKALRQQMAQARSKH